jgi:hypothetical protein
VSPEGKRYAFFAASVAALTLSAFGVVALVTGEWQWIAAAVIALLGAAILVGVMNGLYALAERLFPDR